MRLVISLFLITIFCNSSFSDEPRNRNHFYSENKQFELKLFSKNDTIENWKMIDLRNDSILYEINKEFSSKTILINNDGSYVVEIDDFSESYWEDDPIVLAFSTKGILNNSYRLSDLLNNKYNISISVSHFFWFPEDQELKINDGEFKIKTYELVNYTFDITTGKIKVKFTDPELTLDAIYAYGEIKEIGNNLYEMDIVNLIQGKSPPDDKLIFRTINPLTGINGFHYTIIVKNGYLVKILGFIVNLGKSLK